MVAEPENRTQLWWLMRPLRSPDLPPAAYLRSKIGLPSRICTCTTVVDGHNALNVACLLVSPSGESWWSRRESNPRPKLIYSSSMYMRLVHVIYAVTRLHSSSSGRSYVGVSTRLHQPTLFLLTLKLHEVQSGQEQNEKRTERRYRLRLACSHCTLVCLGMRETPQLPRRDHCDPTITLLLGIQLSKKLVARFSLTTVITTCHRTSPVSYRALPTT
jgi:hypothetical protein